MISTDDILAAWSAHNWILFSALAIGLVVRMLKSDTKLPIDVPSKYRPALALGLGLVAAVLMKVSHGMAWKPAVLSGLGAFATAVLGHEWIVERVLGDKDIPIPGLMKKASPAVVEEKKDEPPTPPMPPVVIALLALSLGGCASWWSNTPSHIEDIAKITECVFTHQSEPPVKIAQECAIENVNEVIDLLKVYKAQVAKEKAAACPAPAASASSSAK